MSVPKPFDENRTIGQWINWVESKKKLYQSHTRLTSFCNDIDLSSVIQKVQNAKSEKEFDALGAEAMTSALRDCAPVAYQMYLMSKNVLIEVKNYMDTNESVKRLVGLYKKYLPAGSACNDPTEIDIYCKAVEGLHELKCMSVNGFDILDDEVIPSLTVQQDDLLQLEMMLRDMIQKRGIQLNTRPVEASHIEDFENAMAADEPIFPFGKKKKNSRGQYLVATALKNLIDNGNEVIMNDFRLKFRLEPEFIEEVEKQIEDMSNAETVSIWKSQKSNVDTLFNAYFIPFAICNLSVENFYKFQRILYLMSIKIRGKENTNAVLAEHKTFPGIKLLKDSISKSTEIHLPPFVLTYNRLHDLYACFTPYDCHSIKTFGKPGVSWRYVLNLKRIFALRVTLTLFYIEKIKFDSAQKQILDNILQSEHMLHQLLLKKTSPYECSNFVKGNALKVHLVLG